MGAEIATGVPRLFEVCIGAPAGGEESRCTSKRGHFCRHATQPPAGGPAVGLLWALLWALLWGCSSFPTLYITHQRASVQHPSRAEPPPVPVVVQQRVQHVRAVRQPAVGDLARHLVPPPAGQVVRPVLLRTVQRGQLACGLRCLGGSKTVSVARAVVAAAVR